jgi:hypothetical protein
MHAFLNKERHAVSKAERDGTPNDTSDKTTAFLRQARAQGADYKGPVFRGTSPAELDQIIKGGHNVTTWSVSKDPEGSAHFAKKSGVMLIIPHGSGAIPVDGLEQSNTFNEALIPKGSKWKIAKEHTAGGVRIVTLHPLTEAARLSDSEPPPPELYDDADIEEALKNPDPKRKNVGFDGGNMDLADE